MYTPEMVLDEQLEALTIEFCFHHQFYHSLQILMEVDFEEQTPSQITPT